MTKQTRQSRGDVSYVIHSQVETEKSFSDDIGNTYEIVEMKKRGTKESSSGVWKYFSVAKNICDGSGDKVVCSLCFEENEIKTYSKVTSSSNLWRHLQCKHGLIEEKPKEHKEMETEAAINEMLRDEGDDGMAFMEEVVVGSEKDLEDAISADEKFVVTSGDINVSIIEEIFKHPEIYDHRNCKCTKQDRDKQWEVVGNIFKGTCDLDHIKKIWKNIRDRYKKLRNRELRSGVTQPPEKRYKYYDLISELDVSGVLSYDANDNNTSESERIPDNPTKVMSVNIAKKRRRSSNDEEFTDVEYLHDRTVQYNEISVDDPLFDEMDDMTEPLSKIKSEGQKGTIIQSLSPMKSAHQLQSIGSEDEYTLFGKLIAEKLRRMPKPRANRLEMKVMALLLIGDE